MSDNHEAAHQADGPTEVSAVEVTRNDDAGQYEAHDDGVRVGFASFVDRGEAIELPHTVVDSQYNGRGYASAIVRYALDDVRAQNKRVIPTCSYVAGWIDKHPEYADLVAEG